MSTAGEKLAGAMRASLGADTPVAAEILSEGEPQVPIDLYAGTTGVQNVRRIPVESLVPDPEQPRKEFPPTSLAELGESMKRRGQLQPIKVREDIEQGRFIISIGERRWRAAKLVGITHLDCIISTGALTADDRRIEALIENCQRENLTPIEQGNAFKALMAGEGWTAERVAAETGLSPQTVGRALALLQLPDEVQEMVEQGALAPTVAAELRQIKGEKAREKQTATAKKIAEEKPSRATAVKEIKAQAKSGTKPAPLSQVTFAVPGGKVLLQGKALCKDQKSKVAALQKALKQAEK